MRMTRFLANITDMTRLETGAVVPRLVPIDPAVVCAEAAERLDDPALVLVQGPTAPLAVLADPLLLEQVVFNVIDNALKYSADVGPPPGPRAHVTVLSEGDRAIIRVTDGGSGIHPNELPHVFDSFYRARHGDRVVPGTGLGLAIARGLVEVMGGNIAAASPVPQGVPGAGRGTLVTISLPLAPGAAS